MHIVRGGNEVVRSRLRASAIAFHHLRAILVILAWSNKLGCPANLSAIHVNVLPRCFSDEGQFIWRDSNNFAVLVVEPLDQCVFLTLKGVEVKIRLGYTSKLRSGKVTKGVQEGIVKQTRDKPDSELLD